MHNNAVKMLDSKIIMMQVKAEKFNELYRKYINMQKTYSYI